MTVGIDPLMTREAVEMTDRPHIPEAMKRRIWERENRCCYLCEEFVPFEVAEWEHRLPRGLLGKAADREENIFPAHKRPCHADKTKNQDMPRIVKAKRQSKLTRPRKKSRRPVNGRGFQKGHRKLQSRNTFRRKPRED